MNFLRICKEKVTVERRDSSRYEDVPALVTKEMVLIPDADIPISPGDAILRALPSGLVERLIVTDPGFHAQILGNPPHYQVIYRREGQESASKPGYSIHVSGENARVNIHSVDKSTNIISNQHVEMATLADELAKLRAALLERAQSREHFVAIGIIATAELAAESGDASKVSQAMSALGAGARWVFDTAKEVGVQVVAEILKTHLAS